MKLLLVEDDPATGTAIKNSLSRSGYSVDWVDDGLDVEPCVRSTEYGLIIMDRSLPNKDGISILKSLRAREFDQPVLLISELDDVEDRVLGLDSGADDYMVKPVAHPELEARLRLLLRRKAGSRTNILRVGNLALNLDTHMASSGSFHHDLSAKEFAILRVLMERPNSYFSKAKLEECIYGWNEEVESNSIEVHICQLRKKLGRNSIQNTRNIGYRLCPPN